VRRYGFVLLGILIVAGFSLIPGHAHASTTARSLGHVAVVKAGVARSNASVEVGLDRGLHEPGMLRANNWYAIPRGNTCVNMWAHTNMTGNVGTVCAPNGAWCWYQRGPSCDPSSGIIYGASYSCPGDSNVYNDWTAVADYNGFEAYMARHCVKAAFTS
jgi:hypothetical protein